MKTHNRTIDTPLKTILFVCYGSGHVNMLLPIIQKTIQDPRYHACVLGLTTARSVLRANNIDSVGFRDFIEEFPSVASEYGVKLANDLPINDNIDTEETIAYLGLSYWDLVCKYGEKIAGDMYLHEGRQAFSQTLILEKIFKAIDPDLVISTSSPRAERAAIIVAGELSILSVCVVGPLATHELQWISDQSFASAVCVFAEPTKDKLVNLGRNPENIFVTGNPAFDSLVHDMREFKVDKYKQKMGWSNKVILWASQIEPAKHPFTGLPSDTRLPCKVEQELIDIAIRNPDWQFVRKHHPSEIVYKREYPQNYYVCNRDQEIGPLLFSADVVIVMTSTVGLQAVMLGKPLVSINQSVFTEDVPYEEMGLSIGIENTTHLEGVLSQCLSGRESPQVRFSKSGNATNRVFAIIEDLLS